MPALWQGGEKRESWLQRRPIQAWLHTWGLSMVVLLSRWCSLSKILPAMFIAFQVQRQVEAGKASKVDIEQWRKLAFPLPVNMQAGAEYTNDSSIMATIILDLQPFNWKVLIGTLQVLEKIRGGDSTFWLCQESSSVRRSSPPYASPKLYKCWEALFSWGLDCHRSSGFSLRRETGPDLVLAWECLDGQL